MGTEARSRSTWCPGTGQKIATSAARAFCRQRCPRMQTTRGEEGAIATTHREKMWISLPTCRPLLVFGWTDLEKQSRRSVRISAFIVERAFKGFSSGTLKEKWGILAGNTGYFKMDDMEVPEENLLGKPGEGFKIAMFALDQGRYTVAAGATGLIRACRDASAKYAKERKTFGVEIGSHQLVKEMLAQMESDYQVSRLLWMRGILKNTVAYTARRACQVVCPWLPSAPRETAADSRRTGTRRVPGRRFYATARAR